MKNEKLPKIDSLISNKPRQKKVAESPMGKPPPKRYRLDDERYGKTVKFEMYSNDDYASLKTELEELKAENRRMKELLLEAVPWEWLKTSREYWNVDEDRWEIKVAGFLLDLHEKSVDEGKRVRKITGYFNIGTYPDGYPGEIFIYTGKQGDETHGWVNSHGKAISMLLQHGISIEKIYEEFKMDEFKPNGITNVKQAPICKSIIDMVMKYMEGNFPPTREDDEDDDDYHAIVDTITEQEK